MIINRVVPLACTSVDAATLNPAVFIALKTLESPALYLKIINNSNTAVAISYNGTTVHDYLIAHDTLELNFQTNSIPRAKQANMAKNTTVYLQGDPGVGLIACTTYTTYE
jgi:hypothetical protein